MNKNYDIPNPHEYVFVYVSKNITEQPKTKHNNNNEKKTFFRAFRVDTVF